MKIWALLLITMNITFFLWQYHAGSYSQQPETALLGTDADNRILLVSELVDTPAGSRLMSDGQCTVESRIEKVIARALWMSDFGVPVDFSGALSGLAASDLPRDRFHTGLLSEPVVWRYSKPPRAAIAPPDVSKAEPSLAQAVDAIPAIESAGTVRAPAEPTDHRRTVEPVDAKTPKTASKPMPKKVAIGQRTSSYEHGMCYEAGPFDSIQHFNGWRQQTGIDRKSIKPVTRKGRKIADYLVYYPAGETYAQSLANLEILKQKGITDYWLFTKGEAKGDISLGVFSSESRAQLFKQQLADKAIEALVKPRYKDVKMMIYAQIHIAPEYEDKLIVSRDKWKKNHPEFVITVNSGCDFN